MSVTGSSVRFSSAWLVAGGRVGALADAARRAELVKWLGLAFMFADHIPRYLGLGVPGWSFLGRMCFPCYAIALGVQVAGRGSAGVVGLRLLIVGCLVSPIFLLVDPVARFDVLVTLGFGVLLLVVLVRWPGGLLPFVGASWCLVGASFGEYGAAGAVLVASAGLWRWRPIPAAFFLSLAGFAAATSVLCLRAGSLGPFAGVLVALGLVSFGPIVPRVRRLFLAVYCVQWPLLFLARLGG